MDNPTLFTVNKAHKPAIPYSTTAAHLQRTSTGCKYLFIQSVQEACEQSRELGKATSGHVRGGPH
jgi:hypothetical protein